MPPAQKALPKALHAACSKGQKIEDRIAWLKLGFHPSIAKHVQEAVKLFNSSAVHNATVDLFPRTRVRVAWRNTLPALSTVTSRISGV